MITESNTSDYICPSCGYARNPKVVDKEKELKEVHEAKDIPDDWNCPGCGIDKEGLLELKVEYNTRSD